MESWELTQIKADIEEMIDNLKANINHYKSGSGTSQDDNFGLGVSEDPNDLTPNASNPLQMAIILPNPKTMFSIIQLPGGQEVKGAIVGVIKVSDLTSFGYDVNTAKDLTDDEIEYNGIRFRFNGEWGKWALNNEVMGVAYGLERKG